MDPLSTTVVGSRHPIVFPVAKDTSLSPHLVAMNGTDVPNATGMPLHSSRIRRKPVHTYKSPAAHELVSLRIEGASGRHVSSLYESCSDTKFVFKVT